MLMRAGAFLQRPGRRYSYKVAHGHDIISFRAAPPVGRKEGFQFLVYGDMGDPDHHRAKAPGCAPPTHWPEEVLRAVMPVRSLPCLTSGERRCRGH